MQTFYADIESGFSGYPVCYLIQFERDKSLSRHERLVTVSILKVLMQFISELPAGYRTVFNLFVFEDKSHKEIARLLGINEKSSASQLVRAKAALAAKVKEWMKRNA